jgi:hypothetical protein
MNYEELLCDLSNEGIRYLTVGGVAVILTGFVRLTADLDIMVDLETRNLEKVVGFFSKRGYLPKVPVELDELLDPSKRKRWHEEKGMVAFMLYNPKDPLEKVDLLIYSGNIDFDSAYNRKMTVKREKGEIHVASIDDLIELKRGAGREKDLLDIKTLLKIKEQLEELK